MFNVCAKSADSDHFAHVQNLLTSFPSVEIHIDTIVSNRSVRGQRMPMRSLIWAFAVRICLMTPFRLARSIKICVIE